MYLRFLWSLIRHKWYVFLEACKLGIPWLGIIHDWSKFRPSEFVAYAQYFYGGWRGDRDTWPPRILKALDIAWLHHQRRNKHHWQYWILIQDEDEDKVLEMPDRYMREMLADWRGAGRAYGNPDTAGWYRDDKEKMQLHPMTRKWIEKQLE